MFSRSSCHAAVSWGADSERYSLDAKEKRTKRNSQTVFNAMLQSDLRWTGDRKSGAHQAERSLTGSMGFILRTPNRCWGYIATTVEMSQFHCVVVVLNRIYIPVESLDRLDPPNDACLNIDV